MYMCCSSLRRHGTHENHPISIPRDCITSRFTTLDTYDHICYGATHLSASPNSTELTICLSITCMLCLCACLNKGQRLQLTNNEIFPSQKGIYETISVIHRCPPVVYLQVPVS